MDEKPRRGPQASPGFYLWTASLRWASAIAQALEPLGLTHTQFFVLGTVSWLGKTQPALPRQSDVAHFNGMDVVMTSKIVRALEARQLLSREEDPEDARAWRLRITPQGEPVVVRAAARVREVDAKFFSPLGARVPDLARDLERLAQKR